MRIKQILKEAKEIVPLNELFDNMMKFMSVLSPIYCYDETIAVKFVVNLQLYYKTIVNLGTAIHDPWKRNCENGDDIGCFGLTELAHGSNVRGILTTATYHHNDNGGEFVIHTPNERAMKFWIGGAAKTSNVSVIFAQLIVEGVDHGPHAFLVPLRNKVNHMPLQGVTLGDCGKKQGLDGVDNGFILFDHFRVPRAALLNRFGNVTPAGRYESPIKSVD